jgi:hypothetical protein
LAKTEMKGPRRSLKNFLLHKKLQLHYAVWVTCVAASIAGALGFLIYEQSTFASNQIIAALNDGNTAWVDPMIGAQIRDDLSRSDLNLAATMFGLGTALALGLMAALIVLTHKVAGPLLRMAKYFDQIGAGRLPTIGHLRKGDQLQHLFETLSATVESLRERARTDVAAVQVFTDACAHADRPLSEELAAALKDLSRVYESKISHWEGI